MRFCICLLPFLLVTSLAQAAKPCYVRVEKWGNFDPKVVQTAAISLINQYLEPAQEAPIFGTKATDCVYTVNLSESMQGFLVLLSGPKINAVGNSRTPGLDGFTQALLRAFRAQRDPKIMQEICNRYSQLMQEDCKPISATVFFYDGKGMRIHEGNSVHEGDEFNVMIQPEGDLYAYVINQDTKGNYFRIFPNSDVSPYTNPLTSGTKYYFPPKMGKLIFSFDSNPGQEVFHFVFSAAPMDDLDQLFTNLEAGSSKNREEMMLLLANAVTSRGVALKAKKTMPSAYQSSQDQKVLKETLGDLLQGKGAFVQTIRLNHVSR